jgi:hypothetical protein
MRKGEPPFQSAHASGLYLIGRNSRGNWVVRDPDGRHDSVFANRVQALKYAMSGNDGRPRAVVMVPQVLEPDLNPPLGSTSNSENCRTECKRVA